MSLLRAQGITVRFGAEPVLSDVSLAVEPGEIVTISPDGGIQSDFSLRIDREKQARCVFEYI